MAPVSINSGELEEIPDLISSQRKAPSTSLPSKVEALIADLKRLPADVKWYFLHATNVTQGH
jgi:hypothetical protein